MVPPWPSPPGEAFPTGWRPAEELAEAGVEDDPAVVGVIESCDCVDVVVTIKVWPPEETVVVTTDDIGACEEVGAAEEIEVDVVELVEEGVVVEESEKVDEVEEEVVSWVGLVDEEVESDEVVTEEDEGLLLALELVVTEELDVTDGVAEDDVVGGSVVVLVEFPVGEAIVNCLNTRIPRCLYAAMSVIEISWCAAERSDSVEKGYLTSRLFLNTTVACRRKEEVWMFRVRGKSVAGTRVQMESRVPNGRLRSTIG
jgi:hypothetical protein